MPVEGHETSMPVSRDRNDNAIRVHIGLLSSFPPAKVPPPLSTLAGLIVLAIITLLDHRDTGSGDVVGDRIDGPIDRDRTRLVNA